VFPPVGGEGIGNIAWPLKFQISNLRFQIGVAAQLSCWRAISFQLSAFRKNQGREEPRPFAFWYEMALMKTALRAPKSTAHDGALYRAFHRLDRDRRRAIALRILRDQGVLADLYDHFLIQEALREPGRRTSWQAYLRRKRAASR
jgi:hypothetical protein